MGQQKVLGCDLRSRGIGDSASLGGADEDTLDVYLYLHLYLYLYLHLYLYSE